MYPPYVILTHKGIIVTHPQSAPWVQDTTPHMTGYTQLINIIDELKETGVTPKVTVLKTKKAPKRSLLSRSK